MSFHQKNFLGDREAEKLFEIKRGLLAKLRSLGRGPRYYFCHNFAIRYTQGDVEQWIKRYLQNKGVQHEK
jgi:hypothetical protein